MIVLFALLLSVLLAFGRDIKVRIYRGYYEGGCKNHKGLFGLPFKENGL
jgi:hypothetical protein